MDETGRQLRELREAAGITQGAVAAELGISQQAVHKWETGASRPDIYRLRRLDRLYGAGGRVLAVFDLAPEVSLDEALAQVHAELARQREEIAALRARLERAADVPDDINHG